MALEVVASFGFDDELDGPFGIAGEVALEAVADDGDDDDDCLSSNMTLFMRERNTSLNEPVGGSDRVPIETGKAAADPREAELIVGNATDADDVNGDTTVAVVAVGATEEFVFVWFCDSIVPEADSVASAFRS